ncbi:MAG: hypothetical protein KAY24_15625 [Candidatus Eisenbacteria sp.]|nr:hypothetical protein [Candidatus Eisenbacteria bacterium]
MRSRGFRNGALPLGQGLLVLCYMVLCHMILFCGASNVASASSGIAIESPAKQYSLVSLPSGSVEMMQSLQIAGAVLNRSYYRTPDSAELVLEESEIAVLRQHAVPFTVLVRDVSAFYAERNGQAAVPRTRRAARSGRSMGFGSMGGFYTFAEAVADLDAMRSLFPHLITAKQSIGSTHYDNPIWVVKISDNPDVEEGEPALLYSALHHANEPQGLMSLIYFMWYLLENYGVDEEVTYLVDSREMYFVPVLNVDGYLYNELSHPDGGGMWRKNGRNNGDGTHGVDLNRNYGYMWGYDDVGSSPQTSSDFYRGPEPFSEPESQSIRTFALQHDLRINLNFHSYGNILLQPFAYNGGHTPDAATYDSYGRNVWELNHYNYGTCFLSMGFLANGTCGDWMYGEQGEKEKVLGFAVEVGNGWDGFWPALERIFPLAEESLPACLLAATYAGAMMDLEDWHVASSDFLMAGAVNDLVAFVTNQGLGDCVDEFSVVLSCDDPEISVLHDTVVFPALASGEEAGNAGDPFQVYIPDEIPVGYYVPFSIAILEDSLDAGDKSFPLIVGMSVEDSAPVEWLEIELHQMLGFDIQCWLETRFEGYGRFLHALQKDDELIYRYFLTGNFWIQNHAHPEQFDYLYRLWAFLDMDSEGEIPTVYFENPSPHDTLLEFHMMEGHGQGYPVLSGSLWYDGGYDTTQAVEPSYSVHAACDFLEYSGIAYEGFEVGGSEYYLVDGTLYDVIDGLLVNPRRSMGTLTYEGEYELNLESGIIEDYWHRFTGEYYDDMLWTSVNVGGVSGCSGGEDIAGPVLLLPSCPNPFGAKTTIHYDLPAAADVNLKIYNLLGQEVRVLVDGINPAGCHAVVWDGANNRGNRVSTGVYFCRLRLDSGLSQGRKLLLFRGVTR